MNRYVSLISRYPCFITYKILTILGIRNTYYDLTSYLTQLLSSVILLKDVILFIFFFFLLLYLHSLHLLICFLITSFARGNCREYTILLYKIETKLIVMISLNFLEFCHFRISQVKWNSDPYPWYLIFKLR